MTASNPAPLAQTGFDIEYPLPAAAGFCMLVHGFLSADECAACIDLAESRGFNSADSDYPPSYRNNERQLVDDQLMAERLFRRLKGIAPEVIDVADESTTVQWRLAGMNERLRFCRYRPGQQFNLHQDGVHFRGKDCQSKLTFMIYLTDGERFSGGDTLFFGSGPKDAGDGLEAAPPIARIRPKAGTLILFDHMLWHSGESVSAGVKHIMRSDLLYRRDKEPEPESSRTFASAHDGYIWALSPAGDRRFASGGRDTSIRIWHHDGSCERSLEGHTQSVLGLAMIDGSRLASVSRDKSLRIWNVETGHCERHNHAHDAAILGVAKLSDNRIATCSADRLIRIWSDTGNLLASRHGHAGWVWSVVMLNDEILASASEDGTVRLWDIHRAQTVMTLCGKLPLRSIDASPSGRQLVTGDIAGHITVWSIDNDQGRIAAHWQAHGAAVRRVRFLDPDTIGSASEDNSVKMWNIATQRASSLALHSNFATDLLPLGGTRYVSCSYDGRIQVHQHQGDCGR